MIKNLFMHVAIHIPGKYIRALLVLFFAALVMTRPVSAQQNKSNVMDLEKAFRSPAPEASPWVFWYWMQGAVSKEGITADIRAMKEAGIGGAYLMPIKDTVGSSFYTPEVRPVRQLSPQWWVMIRHAMNEAKRANIKLAMHVSDGFALAGGPWITPDMSMQKVVWTKQMIEGGKIFNDTLSQPEKLEGYYKDIAVFAFPSLPGSGITTRTTVPQISSSKPDSAALLLATPGNTRNFNCDENCWVQYQFDQPFTCRSITIRARNNYQSNRLIIQTSEDGVHFNTVTRLVSPRHGWQDWDSDYTHAIAAITSRYFRFVFDKSGTEPGAEDLDAAKWKPVLKITGIELSSEAKIHQYEAKNGEVWRIASRTTEQQVPAGFAISTSKIINLTDKLDSEGRLHWNMPAGNWTIVRMGHTSTGHRNETAGGAKGLECDKFNPQAVKLQFNGWIGETIKQAGPQLASEVLKIFHVDSWECGSQNWSANFRQEFKQRRGYDALPFLPAMAGIPVGSVDSSEIFLHDVRQTIAELINDKFYVELAKLAHQHGMQFSAESVAPTMVSDGLLHYKSVDIPMGEFWLRSPTHDKPNDMLDAISGAHIYGKRLLQAEGFTELRMTWDEHPGMLKTASDRNYALGINRMVYHVFMHNPWMNRKPGMTLDAIGLFFQRDQTWWKQVKGWVDYATRCQALLQLGQPVADIAVFTGEEIPRRAVLPDRFVHVLPGIFGEEVVKKQLERLANEGQPLRVMPYGVTHSANMADPENWVNPLRGYAYDSFNPDALMSLAKVKNGKVEFAPGTSYSLLVFPGRERMTPNGNIISQPVAQKVKALVEGGATVLIYEQRSGSADTSFASFIHNSNGFNNPQFALASGAQGSINSSSNKGKLLKGAYTDSSFDAIRLARDFIITESSGRYAEHIAWTHRKGNGFDIYFISNQDSVLRTLDVSLRIIGKVPELWDPLTGNIKKAGEWMFVNGRTHLPLHLEPNGSVFIVLKESTTRKKNNTGKNWPEIKTVENLEGAWSVSFDTAFGGPLSSLIFPELSDWSKHPDPAVKYYSGTAVYKKSFNWIQADSKNKPVSINIGRVANIAEVIVNGIPCGIAWTPPYSVDISKALKQGKNDITILVSNTWANRMIGDHILKEKQPVTNTNSPYRLEGKPLLEAGLLGPVTLETIK